MRAYASKTSTLPSGRREALKGLPHQIIKQIVKITLPSDVVQLQPGKKKKAKKTPRGKGGKGKGGKGPKAPDGFLSHNIRPDQPPPPPPAYPSVFGTNLPRPFAQTPFQTPFQSPFEKMFFEKLRETPKETPKETPMASVSMPSALTPQTPAITLSGKSGEELAKVIFDRARARSQSRAGKMMAEEIPRPAIASPLLRMPVLSGAPNQAVQPSVDVDGDGKEAMKLQPQAPAITFVQARKAPSSSSSSSSSSGSSGMFYDQQEEEEEISIEDDTLVIRRGDVAEHIRTLSPRRHGPGATSRYISIREERPGVPYTKPSS